MDDLGFYILSNSISVISGEWVGDNERLCAMEPGCVPWNPVEKSLVSSGD